MEELTPSSERVKAPTGLTREEHGDLNTPYTVYPGGLEAKNAKIDELRSKYLEIGNSIALQQLDVYDGRSEYNAKFEDFVNSMINGDTAKTNELRLWYTTNYPDIRMFEKKEDTNEKS